MTLQEFRATRDRSADVGMSTGYDIGAVCSGYTYRMSAFDPMPSFYIILALDGGRTEYTFVVEFAGESRDFDDLEEAEAYLFDLVMSEYAD